VFLLIQIKIMKSLAFYFCAVFNCYFIASAQSQNNNLPTTAILPVSPISQQVIDSMPNAYNNKDYTFIKKVNNGNGFDLYESSVDHMMVVKPDNSFHDQMGNRQQYEFVTPDFQKPEQFPNKPEKNKSIQPPNTFYKSIPTEKNSNLIPFIYNNKKVNNKN